jgi:hypothetical protein
MAWEAFKGRSRRPPGEPAITLGRTGSIGINAGLIQKGVKDYKFGLFMFDRDRKLLGVKFIKERQPESYPIKLTQKNNHGTLAGTALMKAYGIFPKETKSYAAKYDEHNKIWYVDLSDEGIGGDRKKAKS